MLKANRTLISAMVLVGLLLTAAIAATPFVLGATGSIPEPGEFICIRTSPSGGCLVGNTFVAGPNNPNNPELVVLLGSIIAQTPSTDGSRILEGVSAFLVEGDEYVHSAGDPLLLSTISSRMLDAIQAGTHTLVPNYDFEFLCLDGVGAWSAVEVISSNFRAEAVTDNEGVVTDYIIHLDFQVGQHGTCAIFVDRDSFPNINVQRRTDVDNPQNVTGEGGISGTPEDTLVNYYEIAISQ